MRLHIKKNVTKSYSGICNLCLSKITIYHIDICIILNSQIDAQSKPNHISPTKIDQPRISLMCGWGIHTTWNFEWNNLFLLQNILLISDTSKNIYVYISFHHEWWRYTCINTHTNMNIWIYLTIDRNIDMYMKTSTMLHIGIISFLQMYRVYYVTCGSTCGTPSLSM